MFRRLIDINFTGTFIVAQVGNAMILSASGDAMILIASMSGHIGELPVSLSGRLEQSNNSTKVRSIVGE
jgi:NAD(P)-dependent dehydrogenase (short-subunit alcohol dehydrogenase family)